MSGSEASEAILVAYADSARNDFNDRALETTRAYRFFAMELNCRK